MKHISDVKFLAGMSRLTTVGGGGARFMKLAGWLSMAVLTGLPQGSVPAFPGAEGFGAGTAGGRGGRVIAVTNLNDSGPGSFREACDAAGPRIVVFRVAGVIDLQRPIAIREPYITIAGQTAPGDGICLKRSEFKVNTHDAIVRFLRSRPGDISGKEMDAMGIGGDARNVIFDHCSANWSVDESLSPSGNISNITVQWCLIGEALNHSVHGKGEHGYGSLARGAGGVTFHHNLWIDNIERNPRLGDNYGRPPFPTFDVRNNVIYNWGKICSGLTGDDLSANYVNNYLRPGPNSSDRTPIVLTKTAHVRYYLNGNVVEGRPQYTPNSAAWITPAEEGGKKLFTLVDKPFEVPPVRTTTAEQALQDVLAGVGATRPVRDAVDARLIEQVRKNTGKVIDSQNQVGGWPMYRTAAAPKDTDGDGIPDSWETSHGMNPRDPKDASAIRPSGYSGIEEYLNDLAKQK